MSIRPESLPGLVARELGLHTPAPVSHWVKLAGEESCEQKRPALLALAPAYEVTPETQRQTFEESPGCGLCEGKCSEAGHGHTDPANAPTASTHPPTPPFSNTQPCFIFLSALSAI